MATQLRCDGTLHGIASDDATGTLERMCKHIRCGYVKGIVILHTFDLATGQVVTTKKFREPPEPRT